MSYTLMIGLGAQKAATSWLHAYFRSHPQCAFSQMKEMHFWSERVLPGDDLLARRYYGRWIARIGKRIEDGEPVTPALTQTLRDLTDRAAMRGDPAAYRRFFDERIGTARVAGEISPSYSRLTAEHLQEMRTCHPDVRPIFVMRDPVDRFWSSISDMVRKREKEDHPALVNEILERRSHLQRGAYGRTVTALEQVFGTDGVLVLFYENLFTEASIHRICQYLDLDPAPAKFEKRVNAQDSARALPDSAGAAIYAAHAQVYDWAKSRTEPLPARWRECMDSWG